MNKIYYKVTYIQWSITRFNSKNVYRINFQFSFDNKIFKEIEFSSYYDSDELVEEFLADDKLQSYFFENKIKNENVKISILNIANKKISDLCSIGEKNE